MRSTVCAVVLVVAAMPGRGAEPVNLRGSVVDAASGRPLPARIYVRDPSGGDHLVQAARADGSAVPYDKRRSERSTEVHTSVSAHPFRARLPQGEYRITVERGKEYLPAETRVQLTGDTEVRLPIRRWVNMAKRGWYSGETHVHRGLDELPTAMLAEDLNVALPLTYWVTRAFTTPSRGDKNAAGAGAELIRVDATHVIYPRNTEYEIFTVGDRQHTLGAVFALGHRDVLSQGVPPVRAVARQVHAEGGLLELDKHNWPWSMMLVPVIDVDLYELTNNHVWRTEFHFRRFGEPPADYMRVEQDAGGLTERGWLQFTFENYYALLNCGFRLRPTAGTASGVHPVPLGFGRVYVYLPQGFSYEAWMQGLDQGRSFVTTGPLMDLRFSGRPPGEMIRSQAATTLQVAGELLSAHRLTGIEILSAGDVLRAVEPDNRPLPGGGFVTRLDESVTLERSSWLAVRCFESVGGRPRFAHSAPVHIDIAGQPLRPRREQVDYLIARVRKELVRNAGVLPDAALEEYREALAAYERLQATAR